MGAVRKMSDRPYWPNLIARVEVLVAKGISRDQISEIVLKEFGLPRQSFNIAVRRGDVPSIAPKEQARLIARKAGQTTYRSKPCVTCRGDVRYVADYRCVACERAYNQSVASA